MIEEFHYRVGWRSRGVHPGRHAGIHAGGDFEFSGHADLRGRTDARHLDIRASLADPFERLWVRTFRQPAAIPVQVLADLSASMGFQGETPKMQNLARFVAAAAWSAFRHGDPFAFYACAESVLWPLSQPLGRQRGLPVQIEAALSRHIPRGRHADGLMEALAQIGREKSLVFVVSDFHLDDTQLDALLDAGAHHDLIPVVTWDPAEYQDLPERGWIRFTDPETGKSRRLLLRPGLKRRIVAEFEARLADLKRRFAVAGREPFLLQGPFSADAMTDYFYRNE